MSYVHPHRNGDNLLRAAASHAKQERDGRDLLVIDIAEIDARRIYREAGFPSIISYCVEELGLSRKAALHRIHVARIAWRLPAILAALAEGRLNLTAVSLLARHVTEDNVDDLVRTAEKKTKEDLRRFLMERFPRQDLFAMAARQEPSLLRMDDREEIRSEEQSLLRSADASDPAMPEPLIGRHPNGIPVARVQVPEERFVLKVALERKTHDKLHQARELLGHRVPSGDMAEILDHVLEVFIAQAEKRKFAATSKPSSRRAFSAPKGHHITAEVKRAVVERDGKQCTFVGAGGKRCPARGLLEFDHIEPVALGGTSTVENLRLRCRTHNQYAAELAFGTEFMRAKIERSRRAFPLARRINLVSADDAAL